MKDEENSARGGVGDDVCQCISTYLFIIAIVFTWKILQWWENNCTGQKWETNVLDEHVDMWVNGRKNDSSGHMSYKNDIFWHFLLFNFSFWLYADDDEPLIFKKKFVFLLKWWWTVLSINVNMGALRFFLMNKVH